jgi:hypothetical protein
MKWPHILAGTGGVVLSLWMGWGIYLITTTARPPHEVVKHLSSDVEIRQYQDQTWISAAHTSDDASFMVLASYIFGRNKQEQQVAMTAPVITDEKMSFILPEGLTPELAPTPEGQAIDFSKVPARTLATIQFSWWTTPDRVETKTKALLDVLAANGIQTQGRAFLMRYNDPWTPPFMRRNEVAIEVVLSD